MTCLVTGAGGFLGGHLARSLAGVGERVRILVRPQSRLDHLAGLDLEPVPGDLADPASLRRAAAGVGHIYHCAAHSSDWGTWEAFRQANVIGVANLLAAAQGVPGLARLVHVSTTDVYGYPRRACTEDTPPRDRGLPYNRTKLQGEALVLAAGRAGLPVTVLRPANLYGPGSKDFVLEITRLLRRGEMVLPGGGHTRAGLLYVADAVAGLIAAAHSPRTLGEVYNLSGTDDLTWVDYVTALAQALDLPPPRLAPPCALALGAGYLAESLYRALRLRRRPLLTRHAVYLLCRDQGYPAARAQAHFGFAPTTSLAEGIARSAAWVAELP